ncbi:MAG: hypothetical protein A2029_12670 [Chloroflexi bacterium RBG_19FT_COMBO_47_9]|nr:MAG: hypothetical protein A2029_12670 [Chloroflexi bacterium RBG_19FT_COMBO_47_9]
MITPNEYKLQSEIHGRNALHHIEEICRFGNRFVGMEGDFLTLSYIEDKFLKARLKIEHTPIRAPTFVERKAEILLSDTGIKLTGLSPYFTVSSHGKIRGELVDIGQGQETDYVGVDVRGKIVVITETQLGFAIFWLGPYSELASRHGAIGMIVIHPFPWPYRMSMEAGNISTENRFVKQQVPAICISAIDGMTLMHYLGQGKHNAILEVDTSIYDVDSTVLSGVVEGYEIPEERIVIMSHRDHAIPPGANDNGSGLGCLIELARVLGQQKLRRSIEFICTPAEEGGSPGMSQYVQAHKDRMNKVKAAINLDMFSTGGRLQLVESGQWHDTDMFMFSPWLLEALETAADDMGYHVGRYAASSTSDETRFLMEGVPSAWFWKPDDVYYHSIHDTPDKVDANSLKAVSDITALTVSRLANLDFLP